MEAVKQMKNGCILNGGVGSGKSRTSLFYYFKEQGGWIDKNGYKPMKNPKDLYIITTARKRDTCEWEGELAYFLLSTDPKISGYKNKVIVNIRPATWYSERTHFKPFESLEDFLAAMEETIYQYPDTRVTVALNWKKNLINSYERHYGKRLCIPRWSDIAAKYSREE